MLAEVGCSFGVGEMAAQGRFGIKWQNSFQFCGVFFKFSVNETSEEEYFGAVVHYSPPKILIKPLGLTWESLA